MTESENVQKLKERCAAYANTELIAPEMKEVFSLLGDVVAAHQQHIEQLETDVSTLKRKLRKVEGRTGLA